MKWELVCRERRDDGHTVEVRKLRLPGGWLYETKHIGVDMEPLLTTVYVHGVNNG